jgi:hypothetical protein
MDKLQYQIQYVDNSYRIVDWRTDEFKLVGMAITDGDNAIVLSDGIFVLRDIRAIVLVPEIVQDEEPKDENQLAEWGFVDQQTAEWLRAQGIDVGRNSK